MTLNEAYQTINKEVLKNPLLKEDTNSAILALHESATKIWEAVANNQNDKIMTRTAGALISVFYIMKELGINDPEKCLLNKLEELKNNK